MFCLLKQQTNFENYIHQSYKKKRCYPYGFIRAHVDGDKEVDDNDCEDCNVSAKVKSRKPPNPFPASFVCFQYG
jgi:hypothetical protein